MKSPGGSEQTGKDGSKNEVVRKRSLKKKLSFNRAQSEPPTSNKNTVVPVKEEQKEDPPNLDSDIRLGELGTEDFKGDSVKNVPPLMIG